MSFLLLLSPAGISEATSDSVGITDSVDVELVRAVLVESIDGSSPLIGPSQVAKVPAGGGIDRDISLQSIDGSSVLVGPLVRGIV